MRRLGKVMHVTKRGLVLRVEGVPELGRAVYDGERRRVGSVLDVFGPIGSPYAMVRPAQGMSHEDLTALMDRELFTRERESHGKGGKAKEMPGMR
ncbi:MAG: Gar1/Naf1 family protein [Candidatus Hodarchaeaceae archaeon]|nr:Gar1/Naf1 family protein [Candidatus Hodarchaeaceae archaeon]